MAKKIELWYRPTKLVVVDTDYPESVNEDGFCDSTYDETVIPGDKLVPYIPKNDTIDTCVVCQGCVHVKAGVELSYWDVYRPTCENCTEDHGEDY